MTDGDGEADKGGRDEHAALVESLHSHTGCTTTHYCTACVGGEMSLIYHIYTHTEHAPAHLYTPVIFNPL